MLSNDSDFAIMKDGCFIPDSQFDLDDTLGLRSGMWMDPGFQELEIGSLFVGVTTSERVQQSLKVEYMSLTPESLLVSIIWHSDC